MSKWRGNVLIILLLSSGYLKAQNPLGFSLPEDKDYVELSFREESNLIVVPIILNGKGPYNFILDTGSESGLIFDRWVIGENNLVNARKIPIYATNGDKITELLVASDLNIQMSGVSASKQSMLVLQENFMNVRSILGVDAHGVLGSELFHRFVVEIDYTNEKIRLYEPNQFKAPKGFHTVDIEVKRLRPYIRTEVKQQNKRSKVKLDLLIDTGASSALFLDEERHEKIIMPEDNVDHYLGSSLSGSLKGKLGRVKKIKFGKYRFRKVLTSYPQNWEITKVVKDKEGQLVRHGSIGSEILSRFTVIYNYFDEEIYLKKNKSYRDKFKFNRIGFSIYADGSKLNQYFISNIVEGSPADKEGFEEDDELIAIAGKPVFFYKFSDINGFLRGDAGSVLDIIIRRNGELFIKRVRLKKLI